MCCKAISTAVTAYVVRCVTAYVVLEFVATDNDTFIHPVVDALLAMLDVATRVDWAHYGILLLNYIDLFLRVFHTVANRARQCCAKPVRCSGLPAS